MNPTEERAAWASALLAIEAATAAADWTAGANAVAAAEALAQTFADPELLEEVPYAAAADLAALAHAAVRAADLAAAIAILDAAGSWMIREAATVRALVAGDLETAVAYLLDHPTAPGRDLAVALAERTATGLLARGPRDDRLLAVATMRGALYAMGDDYRQRADEADAWARKNKLPIDHTAIAEAIVRLAGSRRDDAFSTLIAPHAARLAGDVFETRELLATAAACALRLLEAGDRDFECISSYLLHEGRCDRGEAAKRHITELVASPKRGLRKSHELVIAQAEKRVAGLRDLHEGGAALVSSLHGMTTVALGSFTVETGTVVVTDPCYEGIDSSIQLILRDVARGPWLARRLEMPHSSGARTAFLIAEASAPRRFWQRKHQCPADAPIWHVWRELGIGVDSGQAGMFDIASYRDDRGFAARSDGEEPWYGHVMTLTQKPEQGGTLAHGCVATSGFGDGMYPTLIAYDDEGQIMGIAIDFEVLGPPDDE